MLRFRLNDSLAGDGLVREFEYKRSRETPFFSEDRSSNLHTTFMSATANLADFHCQVLVLAEIDISWEVMVFKKFIMITFEI